MAPKTEEKLLRMGFTWGHFLQIVIIIGTVMGFFLILESRVSGLEAKQEYMLSNFDITIKDIRDSLRHIETLVTTSPKK